MCVKIGEHLDKQISYKLDVMVRVVMNTLISRVLSLLSREAVFWQFS